MTLENALQYYQDIRRLADIDLVHCIHCRRLIQTDGDDVCWECDEDIQEEVQP